jgi:hypothetical protein
MEERKRRFSREEDIIPLIKQRLGEIFRPGSILEKVHIFSGHHDIPDEYSLKLVVLLPDYSYNRHHPEKVHRHAQEILQHRGKQNRLHQNRILFLAADSEQISRLFDQSKTLLAWQSIVNDVESMRLNLDQLQIQQAKQNLMAVKNSMLQTLRETYRWVLSPIQEIKKGSPGQAIEWEEMALSGAGASMQELEDKVEESEWIITRWSPFHLTIQLERWFFQEKKECSTMEFWQKCADFLYLPRLQNEEVLKEAIKAGVESENFFGYAYGKDGEEYQGFVFGEALSMVVIDHDSLLIEKETAHEYKQRLLEKKEKEAKPETLGREIDTVSEPGTTKEPEGSPRGENIGTRSDRLYRRFYGTIELDPYMAKIKFMEVVEELITHLIENPDTNVSLQVEVEAENPNGFDDNIRRIVLENCRQLGFENGFEFTEE